MSPRILVVDDEPDMRMILGLGLQMDGYEVIEAETGEEALKLVSGSPFDLVLLDLNLPGLTGLEILERWQLDGLVPALPVLVLTADARPELDEQTTRRGARECLRKPIRSDELLERIAAALNATVEPT